MYAKACHADFLRLLFAIITTNVRRLMLQTFVVIMFVCKTCSCSMGFVFFFAIYFLVMCHVMCHVLRHVMCHVMLHHHV